MSSRQPQSDQTHGSRNDHINPPEPSAADPPQYRPTAQGQNQQCCANPKIGGFSTLWVGIFFFFPGVVLTVQLQSDVAVGPVMMAFGLVMIVVGMSFLIHGVMRERERKLQEQTNSASSAGVRSSDAAIPLPELSHVYLSNNYHNDVDSSIFTLTNSENQLNYMDVPPYGYTAPPVLLPPYRPGDFDNVGAGLSDINGNTNIHNFPNDPPPSYEYATSGQQK